MLVSLLFITCIPQAKYISRFFIPFAGTQQVSLDIRTQNTAILKMRGILNIEDTVHFTTYGNEFNFELSETTLSKLKRYHCTVHTAEYIECEDAAYITVQVPFFFNQKIKLSRYV